LRLLRRTERKGKDLQRRRINDYIIIVSSWWGFGVLGASK
jgi:hypothetical protein